MRITGTAAHQYSEHLRQVEELLDPIRYDRSIDDAERRRQISEVLATPNARRSACARRASTRWRQARRAETTCSSGHAGTVTSLGPVDLSV